MNINNNASNSQSSFRMRCSTQFINILCNSCRIPTSEIGYKELLLLIIMHSNQEKKNIAARHEFKFSNFYQKYTKFSSMVNHYTTYLLAYKGINRFWEKKVLLHLSFILFYGLSVWFLSEICPNTCKDQGCIWWRVLMSNGHDWELNQRVAPSNSLKLFMVSPKFYYFPPPPRLFF